MLYEKSVNYNRHPYTAYLFNGFHAMQEKTSIYKRLKEPLNLLGLALTILAFFEISYYTIFPSRNHTPPSQLSAVDTSTKSLWGNKFENKVSGGKIKKRTPLFIAPSTQDKHASSSDSTIIESSFEKPTSLDLSSKIENITPASNNTLDSRIFDISSEDQSENHVYDDLSIHATMKDCPEGLGRFAFRWVSANDFYCDPYLDYKIFSVERETNVLFQEQAVRYERENRLNTTTVKDLEPGVYMVRIDFGKLGKDSFQISIFKGKVSLYTYTKRNPFGKNKAAVAFSSRNTVSDWYLSIDNKTPRVITLSPNTEQLIVLLPGRHKYSLTRIKRSELNQDKLQDMFWLSSGYKEEIVID